jgi:two-component system sensor histidine kinase PhoQ
MRARLLLSAAVILTVFGSLSGLTLERAFQSGLQQAQQDKMQTLIYSLLGAASPGVDGELLISIDAVPDPRLRQPLSGLEAALFNEDGVIVWSSTDFLSLTQPSSPQVGEWQFERMQEPNAFSLAFGLRWIDASDDPRRYTVVVLEDAVAYDRQVGVFRRTLWGWLGALLVGLTAILLLLTGWGLAPLRRLGRELQAVESGRQQQIAGQYPDELRPLARDLNTMIVSERNQLTRYRNALGDLAHSLKTPLAVLRGIDTRSEQHRLIQEQVDRMRHIVDHQLRRAAAAGRRSLTEPVPMRPLADKLIAALSKVYADKSIDFGNHISASLRIRADQADLYELLGNLLDNAAKYGRQRVRVDAQEDDSHCAIVVEDDGDGFPDNAEALLQRGARADTRQPGQGLGLASVAEVVQAYGGRLLLERSTLLGGARVTVTLALH